ncbi:MAG: leucine-rich repeat domain-containing protein [Proteobacteria bacterium]|nr:leucine-rich repeat domain-containing protein [Pseudomonadota bacterium]
MADKQSPFSSFLKKLGDPKFIQDLGDAAAKAIDAATKAIENVTEALDASEDKRKGENHTAKPKQANAQNIQPIKPTNEKIDNGRASYVSNITPASPPPRHATSTHNASKPQNPIHTSKAFPTSSNKNQSDGSSISTQYAQNNINDTVSDIQFKFPENATSTSCTPILLPNGLHIRQYQWYQPATYPNAWEAHEGRPSQDAGWRICDVLTEARSDQQTLIIDKPERILSVEDKHYAFHIAPYAFLHAPHLKSIIFKTHNTSVADRAFAGHKSLKSVTFEQSVSRIGKKSFYACSALKNVIFQKDIRNIDEEAFANSTLKAIIFKSALLNISARCFANCKHLKNIYIPDSCSALGNGCFENCTTLKYATLPRYLRIIPDRIFAGCYALEEIQWPNRKVYEGQEYPRIGKDILADHEPMPDKVRNNRALREQWFPSTHFELINATMKRIENYKNTSFQNYIQIIIEKRRWHNRPKTHNRPSKHQPAFTFTTPPQYEITFPHKLITHTFQSHKFTAPIPNQDNSSSTAQTPSQIQNDFSEITGPVLKAITNAFQNLKTNVITQSHSLLDNLKNASALSSESGFQFTQGNYGVKIISYKGSQKRIVIPDGIKDIGANAFQNNQTIEEVILPNSVWNIGQAAFKNCKSLKHVSLPNNEYFVTTPSELFKGCTSLTTIIWNPKFKLIRRDSIEDCPLSGKSLQFLQSKYAYSSKRNAYILPQIAKSDEFSGTFTDDDQKAPFPSERNDRPQTAQSEQQLDIMSKFVSAFKDSFSSPPDIKSLKATFDFNLPHFGKSSDREKLNSNHPNTTWDSDLYVQNNVLVGLKENLTELIIPEYINEVEPNAFNLGTKLRSITFKGKINTIGENAFCGLDNLQSVIFEDDVQSIESCAFKGCSKLENVIFKKDLIDLWNNCFEDCRSLKEIVIPDSCEIIGENCFAYCISLRQVHLPANLKCLSSGTFNFCLSLESLDWPATRTIDKHTYPKLSPNIFTNVLSDDNWEKFELQNGTFRRILVPALSEDPDGLFDMMLPGEATITRRLPQLVMNATLNHIWEHSANDEQYELLLTLLKTCLSVARVFTIVLEDDRSERLCILDDLRLLLHTIAPVTVTPKKIADILPSALYDTLFAICGKGSIRKYYDKQILKLTCPYMNIDPKDIDAITHDTSDSTLNDINLFRENIFKELQIGPHQPFRYDAWQTSLNVILNMDDADFYTFNNYMSSLAESIFHKRLSLDVDMIDSHIDSWCLAWNNLLHESYSQDFHVVMLNPHDFEKELAHEADCRYIAILTWEQIYDLRKLLKPFELDRMITVYTMELHSDDHEAPSEHA